MGRTMGLPLAVLLQFCPGIVSGQQDGIEWLVNGYGTLGAVHSSDRHADYVPDQMVREGAGRSGAWTALTDSRGAVQIEARLAGSRLSAVVQVVAEAQYDRTFGPEVEWANLQFDWSPAVTLRAGRIALGTYMTSDHRKVGYTLPWVRPPAEVYQLVSITNSDGVDASWRTSVGSFQYSAQLSYGEHRMEELGGDLEAPNIISFTNRLEDRFLTLHASIMKIKLTAAGLDPLWQAYRGFGAAGEQVVQRYEASGEWAEFVSVGAGYDPGEWFMMAEWGQSDGETAFGGRYGWYLSGGWRIGGLTPYLTFSRGGGDYAPADVEGLDPAPYPEATAAFARQLNSWLRLAQAGITPHQTTLSAGLRWDFRPGISATMQWDDVTVRNGSLGSFRNMEADHQPRGADVFSVALDFVF